MGDRQCKPCDQWFWKRLVELSKTYEAQAKAGLIKEDGDDDV